MIRIFDFSDERDFAAELVLYIAGQLPAPSLTGESAAELTVNKVTRLLERVYRDAEKHFKGKPLGVVRRSVFANAFKWGLREKGYPANFVDVATEGLIMELAKTKK